MPPDTVIFDLGRVLIEWDPRHLYRKLFDGDEAAMERFLETVTTAAWNAEQDRGRPFGEGSALLRAKHPDQAALIDAYHLRWPEMMPGEIAGTVAILRELHAAGVALHAITNWSAETYPYAIARFDWLRLFRSITVSGHERLIKPDPAIFTLMLERNGLAANRCVFIDDNADNVAAAARLGMRAVVFTTPDTLRAALAPLLACKRQDATRTAQRRPR